MKNFNSVVNSITSVFILSISVLFAVYLTGFIVTLAFGFVSLALYAVGSDWSCDNVIGVIGYAIQYAAVAAVTIKWCSLLKMKPKHILLSVPITALLFLLIERFFFSLHSVNLPWQMLIYPKLYEYMELEKVTYQVFIDNKLYLFTTALLTVINSAVVILSCVGMHLIDRHNKQ